ncbi:MAG TPA: hypothetical protein VFZ51_06345, partial [Woeseiaceae bacterium]
MRREQILRVAINAPLSRLFDYLEPPSWRRTPEPGCRLRVPFGRKTRTAMLFEVGESSELPLTKLRPAHEIL